MHLLEVLERESLGLGSLAPPNDPFGDDLSPSGSVGHGLDELVNAINQDARWGAAAVERFSAKDVAEGHAFLLVEATRSEPVPHPVRADPLALRPRHAGGAGCVSATAP